MLIVLSEELPAPGCAFYIGFDPTASSLHLGNLLGLMASDQFARAGFRPIFLLGGATARVGDPSFRDHAKMRLDNSIIDHNMNGLRHQLRSLFPDATIVDNYEWQGRLNLLEFLDDVGSSARLSSMLGRESVQRRLESSTGMSFTEFTYQLLQAYDFLHLLKEHNCRLQLGGSDQWGNIVAGVELIGRQLPEEKVVGLTFPLLTTSGGGKMGKSEGNALWLDANLTSPFDMYQYLLRLSDTDARRFLPMLTRHSLEEIASIQEEHERCPERRFAQRALASDIVTFVHGSQATDEAIRATKLLFDEYESIFTNIDSIKLVAKVLSTSGRMLTIEDVAVGCTILQALNKLLPDHSNSIFLSMLPTVDQLTLTAHRCTAHSSQIWRNIH